MYKLIISRDYLLLPFCQIIWTNILQDCIAASNNLSNLLNKRDCLKITGLKWKLTMFLQKILHPIVNCAVGAPFAQMGDRWMEFVLKGHSTTTWTIFYPILIPSHTRVDNCGHIYLIPTLCRVTKRGISTDPLLFLST